MPAPNLISAVKSAQIRIQKQLNQKSSGSYAKLPNYYKPLTKEEKKRNKIMTIKIIVIINLIILIVYSYLFGIPFYEM